jgi:t-SNARE complex subunit (syntaxin)
MAELVLEQGTIIDRIDYNIDKAMDHTEKGVEHLRKA